MYRKVLTTLFSLLMAVNFTFAQDAKPKPDAATIEKLGAIRARVNTKSTDLQKLVNPNSNGITIAQGSLATQYNQSVGVWQKRLAAENAKAADARDQAIIDSLNGKLEKASAMWNQYATKDLPLFNQQLGDINVAVTALSYIVSQLSPQDQNWVRADLDPAQLVAVFTSVDKRLDEVTASANTVVKDWLKSLAEREKVTQE